MAIDTEKITDNARWERWEDLQDEKEEREIRQQLDELRLDGSYDHYHKQFLSLSDEDIERLSGWYDAGDLCRQRRHIDRLGHCPQPGNILLTKAPIG